MGMIIDVFARYSGAEGNKQSLTKGELKALMEKELPGFLQVRALGPGGQDGGSTWGRASPVPEQGRLREDRGEEEKEGVEGRRDSRGQDPAAPKWREGDRAEGSGVQLGP